MLDWKLYDIAQYGSNTRTSGSNYNIDGIIFLEMKRTTHIQSAEIDQEIKRLIW